MAQRIDKPNFEVPLVASYNERGIQGFESSITDSNDQKKVNLYYEVAQNSLSGDRTVTLSLRPGVTVFGGGYGVSSQVATGINQRPESTKDTFLDSIVFSELGTSSRAATSTATTTFAIGSGFYPRYNEMTYFNNQKTLVVQVENVDTVHQQSTFYCTTYPFFDEIVSTFSTFTHTGRMEFMDGYGFILDRATNRIQNSNLNTISTWPSGNFITKQITQDTGLGLGKFKDKLLAFGHDTVEVFYNGGLTPAPLIPIKSMSENIGISPQVNRDSGQPLSYYTIVGGRMYFPGTQAKGEFASLMSFDGSRFEKVSPPYIDKIIQDTPNLGSIGSFITNGQAFVTIQLNLPSASSQRFLVYFPQWNDWFEWNSVAFAPIFANGLVLGTGGFSDRLMVFRTDNETFLDQTSSYSWLTQFKVPTNGSYQQMPMYGVVADTSRSTNNMTVEFNDADGVAASWVTTATIDLSQERKLAFRGGAFRERLVRLSGTTSTEVRLHKFVAVIR